MFKGSLRNYCFLNEIFRENLEDNLKNAIKGLTYYTSNKTLDSVVWCSVIKEGIENNLNLFFFLHSIVLKAWSFCKGDVKITKILRNFDKKNTFTAKISTNFEELLIHPRALHTDKAEIKYKKGANSIFLFVQFGKSSDNQRKTVGCIVIIHGSSKLHKFSYFKISM